MLKNASCVKDGTWMAHVCSAVKYSFFIICMEFIRNLIVIARVFLFFRKKSLLKVYSHTLLGPVDSLAAVQIRLSESEDHKTPIVWEGVAPKSEVRRDRIICLNIHCEF